MVKFSAIIEKFGQNGDKTGWIFVRIPAQVAEKIKKGRKTSFRVKGCLDSLEIAAVALLPAGEGDFLLPLNAGMRKQIRKSPGEKLSLSLEEDKEGYQMNALLLDCLADEPSAQRYLNSLTPSHQRYFSKWVDDAKTDTTQAKRIALIINALNKGWTYVDMIRAQTAANRENR